VCFLGAGISPLPNRPDLAQISGTAQLVSHLAFHALRADTMHPVHTGDGCPLPPPHLYKEAWDIANTTAAATPLCIQSAAFSSQAETTWAILNSCLDPVPLSLVSAAEAAGGTHRTSNDEDLTIAGISRHDITTYNISDPGGWAPLPADPNKVPWTTGPLRPRHMAADKGLPAGGWSAPALSFSIMRLVNVK
jgi:hypothetical protein